MGKTKFSVLIPVYNVENFLVECLDSVLKQGYKDFEIILIDDGSTDSSGKICDEYAKKDNRVKVYHQSNQGLIMARRNAIPDATGDFCLFLDSDDYWNFGLLEMINETICKYNCDMVIYKYNRVSKKGAVICEAESVFKDKMIFDRENKEQLFKKIINSSDLNNLVCKAVKHSIIDNVDYSQYKKIRNAEDLLQSIPLLYNAEKIVYIDKPMYNYRMVSTSMTQTFNINLFRDVTTVRGVLMQYIQKLKIDNEDNLNLFYQFYIKAILDYIFALISSNITKIEKIEILNNIKNLPLYIDTLNYIDTSNLSLRQKNAFYLFNKDYFQVLFVYARTVEFLKKILNSCSLE